MTSTKDENEDERRKRRRKTKTSIEKEQKKVKKWFQNKCAFPTMKEGGFHLPSASWLSRFLSSGRTGSVPWKQTLQEAHIKYWKCPTDEKRNKNAGKVFRIQLIGPPKQTKQMKQKCSWVWEQTKKHKNESNDTKQLFHSLFLGCVCTQKNSNSLGEPCCS